MIQYGFTTRDLYGFSEYTLKNSKFPPGTLVQVHSEQTRYFFITTVDENYSIPGVSESDVIPLDKTVANSKFLRLILL
jgi:hypothetical protein